MIDAERGEFVHVRCPFFARSFSRSGCSVRNTLFPSYSGVKSLALYLAPSFAFLPSSGTVSRSNDGWGRQRAMERKEQTKTRGSLYIVAAHEKRRGGSVRRRRRRREGESIGYPYALSIHMRVYPILIRGGPRPVAYHLPHTEAILLDGDVDKDPIRLSENPFSVIFQSSYTGEDWGYGQTRGGKEGRWKKM